MRDSRRTRVVLVVLLAIALALIAINYSDRSNSALSDARAAGGTVLGGAESAVSSVTGLFRPGSSGQVKALESELAQLRAELAAERLSKSDYAQLRKLLLLAGAGQYRIVAASVIAVGSGYQQSVTLDAGSSAGIHPDETVLNGEGLVGEVTSVTATTSTVLLASDSSEVVGVALAPSGQLGWVSGPGKAGGGLMHLEMLSSAAILKPGDELVTAASVRDRPFVPGVPVGVVTRLEVKNGALTEAALVRPFVDFAALGIVGVVIVTPAHNPQYSELPPLPHPGPTVTVTVTAKPGSGSAKSGSARSGSAQSGTAGPAPHPGAGG